MISSAKQVAAVLRIGGLRIADGERARPATTCSPGLYPRPADAWQDCALAPPPRWGVTVRTPLRRGRDGTHRPQTAVSCCAHRRSRVPAHGWRARLRRARPLAA